jgi:hypothetical protein
MLDQILKLVEQNAGDTIVKNDAIPNQFNKDAIQDVATQIYNGLQGQAKQGNVQELASVFKGGAVSSNPMVDQIISTITGSLASKFNVSPQAASSIANSLIPVVMNQLVKKTSDPNDKDFDLQNMLKNLTGNSNVGDMLSQVTGKGDDQKDTGTPNVLGNLFK